MLDLQPAFYIVFQTAVPIITLLICMLVIKYHTMPELRIAARVIILVAVYQQASFIAREPALSIGSITVIVLAVVVRDICRNS